MPKYRIPTNERRWVRCIYEVNAEDVKQALALIEEEGQVPVSITSVDGDFSSDDVQFLSVEPVLEEPAPKPRPEQGLAVMAQGLSVSELQRLVSVIQKLLWWSPARTAWERDIPPSLGTLDLIADVLDRAGLRPVEIELPKSTS